MALIWGGEARKLHPPFPLAASWSSPRCTTSTRCPQVCPWSDPARGSRQLCQHGGTLAATTASMSDFWHKLGCCVVEKPQPVSTSSAAISGRGVGSAGTDGLHHFAEEEEETDRPLHDRGAHELRPPDAHRLRRHGRGRGAAHGTLTLWAGWGSVLGCWVSELGDRWCFWGGRCWFWGGGIPQLDDGCCWASQLGARCRFGVLALRVG